MLIVYHQVDINMYSLNYYYLAPLPPNEFLFNDKWELTEVIKDAIYYCG